MTYKRLFYLLIFTFCIQYSNAQVVSTIAGMLDSIGVRDDVALNATFNNPHGVEVDKFGNIYIADRYNHLIRKLDNQGNVTTIAGTGTKGSADGQGTLASFNEPWGITVGDDGTVYVADTKNNKIRMISPSGLVTTLAGTGTFGVKDNANPLQATFGNPVGIAIDKQGNLYIGDHLTHLIRKISVTGTVTTLAGDKNYPTNFGLVDGNGQSAQFYRPYGIEVDKKGNVYVADEWNHAIRKVTPTGDVTTLGGVGVKGGVDGPKGTSSFNYPWDVAIDSLGNVYVADGYNYVIRKIDTNLITSVYAGIPTKSGALDGMANVATFNGATSLSISKINDYLIVGDAYNQLIRKITIPTPIPNPVISFSNTSKDSSIICNGLDVSINIQNNFDVYSILVDGKKVQTTTNKAINVLANYLPIGVHTIEVKGQKNGYYDQLSNKLIVTVLKNSTFSIIKNKSATLCYGDSLNISTSDNSIVTWSTGKTTSGITLKSNGKYYITAVAGQCLTNKDTVTAVFNQYPTSQISKSSLLPLYTGDTLVLLASPGTNYLWSTNETTQQIKVTNSGKYAVLVSNQFGCATHSDTVSVVFKPIPSKISIIDNGSLNFCQGDSLQLKASYAKNIQWFKDGKLLTSGDSIIYIKESGTYYFICVIDSIKTLYSDTNSYSKKMLPQSEFTFTELKKSNSYALIQFTATNTQVDYSYSWKLNGVDVASIYNPAFTFNETNKNQIQLTVKDKFNCENSELQIVSVELTNELFIPTAFTPNGDGVNDKVKLLGIPASTKVNLMIFNEWGHLVFSTTSATDAWDGTYKGELANAGNYSYLLDITLNGEEQHVKGIITLIR